MIRDRNDTAEQRRRKPSTAARNLCGNNEHPKEFGGKGGYMYVTNLKTRKRHDSTLHYDAQQDFYPENYPEN